MSVPDELPIDIDRVIGELHALAQHSSCDEPTPTVTRIVYSDEDIAARGMLRALYESAGLAVRVDAVGNTFARWLGTEPDLPAVGTGSHCDAIPHAGMYDGTVGVLGGLEAIRCLAASGFRPRRSIELVMITSEEPTRFGIGCLGSRVMVGSLTADDLRTLTDDAGDSVDAVRRRAGFGGDLTDARLKPGYFRSWVELHIEQGRELEARDLPIGIVTAIAAPATMTVVVTGVGGHAGAVLMPGRRDALAAAAEMITAIETLGRDAPGGDLVVTVGRLDVHPGAVNSIPSRVTFSIDLRDVARASRDRCGESIRDALNEIASRRDVDVALKTLNADPPATCDAAIIAAAIHASERAGLSHQRMISRAYHDSLFIAQVAPAAMIFIPCRDGVSHRGDEYASPDQIRNGIQVLARTLATLSHS